MEIVKEMEKQGKQCEEEFGTSEDHLVEATIMVLDCNCHKNCTQILLQEKQDF